MKKPNNVACITWQKDTKNDSGWASTKGGRQEVRDNTDTKTQ